MDKWGVRKERKKKKNGGHTWRKEERKQMVDERNRRKEERSDRRVKTKQRNGAECKEGERQKERKGEKVKHYFDHWPNTKQSQYEPRILLLHPVHSSLPFPLTLHSIPSHPASFPSPSPFSSSTLCPFSRSTCLVSSLLPICGRVWYGLVRSSLIFSRLLSSPLCPYRVSRLSEKTRKREKGEDIFFFSGWLQSDHMLEKGQVRRGNQQVKPLLSTQVNELIIKPGERWVTREGKWWPRTGGEQVKRPGGQDKNRSEVLEFGKVMRKSGQEEKIS